MVSQNALEDNYSSCDKTATSIPSRFDINQTSELIKRDRLQSIVINADWTDAEEYLPFATDG